MRGASLARDYVKRAQVRLQAVQLLFDLESWADTVRESQEAVELALKGLLRYCRIEPPRTHDVSDMLETNAALLPESVRLQLPAMLEISRQLRRDRELAFYGSEDLTPSEFYRRADAERALQGARFVVEIVAGAIE